jgi:Protein of unknown function (DUF2975)
MDDSLTLQPAHPLRDRLLRTTLVILRLVQYTSAALAVLVVIVTTIFWLLPDVADRYLNKTPAPDTLISFTGFALLALISIVMAFLMFGHLIKIVNTVGEGNAFTTENSERLRKIAYLSLGILGSEFVLAWVEFYQGSVMVNGRRWFDWDPSSIITILILFVLARVFEEGVRLNDEAQFTV